MKGFHLIVLALLGVLLTACASNEPKVDTSLYEGKPIDSLSSDEPPKTEKEAITRGDNALSAGNVDLALYEYIRSLAFENGQFHDRSLYNIGRIHQSRNNLPLAQKAYQLAMKENPDNVKVLEQLGTIYSRSGDVASGSSYYMKAINADQIRLGSKKTLTEADLSTSKGIAMLKTDDYSPEFAYMGLGVIADIDTEHKLAQAYYKKALSIKPHSVKTLTNVGYSFYMEGDYRKAQRFTLEALDKDPTNDKALNNLALIYLGKGEITRAINVFSQHMDKPEALNNVGYFLILQGKPDKAIPYLQQAIDTKTSYYKVANENLERALAMVREEKTKTAAVAE
ncbi:tetratricopeptide repeat protein [Vibrio coralliilyticus]|uniref:TPR repeat protein n=1 Tax=Vibrio coralliilyticus TaxID=190893 RepID=A0AAN0VW60_9VIBR|nr:tetratricopeptide repeat protein [Vibrio coralliilyticus]AIW17945.1 TPR repeat protein [Vibrio coralliilyticus]NOH37081.1 tetratricopeptide repeat protein [Vibrio coralliilyticus]